MAEWNGYFFSGSLQFRHSHIRVLDGKPAFCAHYVASPFPFLCSLRCFSSMGNLSYVFQVRMSKSKASWREIGILSGAERIPIYQLNSIGIYHSRKSGWCSINFKSMLSKYINIGLSLKRPRRSQSSQEILEGVHEPREEEIVESFRQLLFVEGLLPGKHTDDHTLLRFLRMRDFDQPKAKEMFVKYLKWREEFGVDAMAQVFKPEDYQEVKKCYSHGFHGVDRYGRPVYIERIGLVDLTALLQVTTIEKFVKYHVFEQEKTLNWRYPACSIAAKKHIASTTTVLDVKDVGISSFSKSARYLFMEIQKIDSNYYPETLHRLLIVNAGSGFRALWKAIRTFLDQRTLKKIQVLGSDYRRNLVEIIDPSNLPSFLGGNCSCSESGGCLFSDKGPWNDPDIMETLLAMIQPEEVYDDGENSRVAAKEDLTDKDDIQIKDIYDVNITESSDHEWLKGQKVVNKPELDQLQALEAALTDAKRTILTLEAAIEDAKMVLKGLTQHIDKLKNIESTGKQNII